MDIKKQKMARMLEMIVRSSKEEGIYSEEIEYGLQKLGPKRSLADFHEFIEDQTLLDVIPVEPKIALLAAQKPAELQKKGII